MSEMLDESFIEAVHAFADALEPAVPYMPDTSGIMRAHRDLANFQIQPYAEAAARWFDPVVDLFKHRAAVPHLTPHVEEDWETERSDWEETPPSPLLVGVELNPGPPKSELKKLEHELKVAEKMVKHTPHVKAWPGKAPLNKKEKQQKPKGGGPTSVAAAFAHGYQTRAPRMSRSSNNRFTIEHSELITTVNGTASFGIRSLVMQPGLSSVFQWLSTQVNGWEKYRWKYLRARYATRTGSGTPGTVMLVPDYDSTDPLPNSEVSCSSFVGSTNDAPWKDAVVHFDMGRSKELFLRTGPTGANLDPKTYDFATLAIATQDGVDLTPWGKVWVEYGIELITPQAITLANVGGGALSGGASFTVATPYGSTPQIANGTIVVGIDPTDPQKVLFSNLNIGGEYIISTTVTGTTCAAYALTVNGLLIKNAMSAFANASGSQFTIFYTYWATTSTGWAKSAITAAAISQLSFTIAPLSNSTPL